MHRTPQQESIQFESQHNFVPLPLRSQNTAPQTQHAQLIQLTSTQTPTRFQMQSNQTSLLHKKKPVQLYLGIVWLMVTETKLVSRTNLCQDRVSFWHL